MLNRNTPIRKKLMAAILLTCGVVSVLTFLSFVTYEYYSFRQSLVGELSTLGQIVASNSSASLAFEDKESADEILSALKAQGHVVMAGLYDEEGKLFSKYPSNLSNNLFPLHPQKHGYSFNDSHLSGFQPVMQNQQFHGTLYIKSDMKAIGERFRLYGMIVILILTITFLLAYILSQTLQKRISEPILALTDTAKAISDHQDYSVRAIKMGTDEIGQLTDAFNNMVTQIQAQNSDIIQFSQKLDQNRIEIQNILDRSLDVICTIDEQGNFVKISAASKNIWGYLPEELTGTKATNLIYKDDLQHSENTVENIKRGADITNFENRYIRKDGRVVPLIWSARWEEDEKVMYCVAKDATAIKNAESQLQKRAKELATSNEELEQFAYIASHDLQEPLRMVTSFLSQLEKKYKDQLDDKAQQYIHFAVDGAVRMRRIILDLLEYSRVGKNTTIEPVDINDILNEIVQFNRSTIAEKKATVVWERMPVIHGASTPLQQVFQNLISNAMKYQVEDIAPLVTISAKETTEHWQFSVTDNGIGIDPQFFDKIFLAFQRLHTNKEYPGSGIGLAICKKIVESHGGEIWVKSLPGQGSTFSFTILKDLRSV